MDEWNSEWLLRQLSMQIRRMEQLHLSEYLRHIKDWKKRLGMDFLSGIARGIGFSVGFSVLGALLIYFLKNAALANLPVIGRFVAEVVRIVENNL